MSWNAYIDRMVADKVELCAIHGKGNGAAWASSPGICCSPDEIIKLATAIQRQDKSIFEHGVLAAGQQWTVILLEPESELLILKGKDCENKSQSLIVAMSMQAVIIGANKDKDVGGGTVRTSVERIRDYLKSCQL